MRIEFVGCSGAGKTTLIERLTADLRRSGRPARCSTTWLAELLHTSWIRSISLRNLCHTVCLAPWLLEAIPRIWPFFAFGLGYIIRNGDSSLSIAQRTIAFVRQCATDAFLTCLDRHGEVILIDEGLVSAAQNVLVHIKRPPSGEAIRAYAQLVPQPDLVIHIDPPLTSALRRCRSRPDPPMRFLPMPAKLRFVRLAHRAFRSMANYWAPDSWVTVAYVSEDHEELEKCYHKILKTITSRVSCSDFFT